MFATPPQPPGPASSSAAGPSPYYARSAFGTFMPLAVLYATTSRLASLLLRPFPPFGLARAPLRPEDCFLPPPAASPGAAISSGEAKGRDEGSSGGGYGGNGGGGGDRRHVAIVTGSNTGVGFETALSLVERGYDVVLACRSRDRGEAAADRINSRVASSSSSSSPDGGGTTAVPFEFRATPGRATFLHPLDTSSFDSVRSFAEAFRAEHDSLNVLVNNAGVNTRGVSADGLESCFQTNIVGHYVLTRLLLPCLLVAKNRIRERGGDGDGDNGDVSVREEAGRVVNLSSVMHHICRTDESDDGSGTDGSKDKHSEEGWWREIAKPGESNNTYAQSKLAAILFAIGLNERYGGDGLRSIAVNPGSVNSDIWRDKYPKFLLKYIVRPAFRIFYLSPEDGCRTSVAAAVGNIPEGALYLQPYWQPQRIHGDAPNSGSATLGCLSFRRRYRRPPFPVFEMLGPFAGHAVTEPRLPNDGEGGSASARALWEACAKLGGL